MGILKRFLNFIGIVFDIKDLGGFLRRMVGISGSSVIIVGAINWLGENVPSLSLILFGVGIFLLGMALLPNIIRIITKQKPQATTETQNMTTPQFTPQDQQYADWMTAAIQDDVRDLSGCITVSELPICWEHLEERGDAYIEFNFDILSSSVHLLEISKQVEGHTFFQGGELERKPEITQKASQLRDLRRSKVAKLTIKQWLSFQIKTEMKTKYRRSQVEFDFSKVNISVMTTLPDGSQGPTCRLPIPDAVCAKIPDHPNAPVPDKEGSPTE